MNAIFLLVNEYFSISNKGIIPTLISIGVYNKRNYFLRSYGDG
jgi:hypothetical protein